jgi:twitching motility two-component system response regulator PilH
LPRTLRNPDTFFFCEPTIMPIKTILIVDDSPTERHILTELLTGAGYQVTTADSGDEGIERAKQIKPDLVLMDVVMPGTNGFQATRALSRDPITKDIPVIMCTTKNQETDKLWGMRQGAHDYVTKPIDAPALLAKIAAL